MEQILLNQEFEILETAEKITVSSIIYHKINSDGKKEKLKDPICFMSYENGRTAFSTYNNEIIRMLDFKRWKKI